MPKKLLVIEQVLAILPEIPARISELTDSLKLNQYDVPPSQGEWSINEVLAHLRACADVWGECIETILSEDKPTIRAVNPTTYINQTNYPELEFLPSLQAFTIQRKKLMEVLEPLMPEDWQRSAIIVGAGKPLERTVHFYAQWLARHERTHLKQFKKIVDIITAR